LRCAVGIVLSLHDKNDEPCIVACLTSVVKKRRRAKTPGSTSDSDAQEDSDAETEMDTDDDDDGKPLARKAVKAAPKSKKGAKHQTKRQRVVRQQVKRPRVVIRTKTASDGNDKDGKVTILCIIFSAHQLCLTA
jgi:hypothetical protein